MKSKVTFFALLIFFSEINLENALVFHSFRQTLKHMVLWVRPLLAPMLGVPDILETVEM